MTNKEFGDNLDIIINKCTEVLANRQTQYTTCEVDRFENFKVQAGLLGCTIEQAAIGNASKHIAKFAQKITQDRPLHVEELTELIEENGVDIINYMIIIISMLMERRSQC